MRVVVTRATGNVGTSVVRALGGDRGVDQIVAVARRAPQRDLAGAEFVAADVAESELTPIFRGADAVVHLAWLIQPGRDESVTSRVNLLGSRRVFECVVAAQVPALVYASSVGAYSPGPKDRFVDESWPTEGIATSFYSRHKAAVERDLDQLEREHPSLLSDCAGAFNVTAEPPVGTAELATLLDAPPRTVPPSVLRKAAAVSFALRLQPVEPGWLDMALSVPLMSTQRVRQELGWEPRLAATEAIRELMIGMREGADDQTPPLGRSTSGPARVRELLTGLGARQ